jgi:diguanylate cyclase (GGDEF)-like protein
MKEVLLFFLPGGMLLLVSLLLVHLQGVQANLGTILQIYPQVTYLVAVVFGWRFNRSTLVFGTIAIALTHWCLMHFGTALPNHDIYWRIAYISAALLLPLNLLFLSLVSERGIFTPRGIIRLVFILAQPFFVGIIAGRNPERYVELLGYSIFPWQFLHLLRVPQIPAMACLLSLLIITFMYIRERSAKESGFFWAVSVIFMALACTDNRLQMGFYFATGSFILLVSVIEVSHAMAFKDELTGLPARRALKEDLLKLGGDYCLAMLDIDHFKKFNDKHGHDVGDQVLRMVASRLAQVTGGGKAFRYGGEEFTVIFPGRHADDALVHLEALRKDVAHAEFAIRSRMRPKRKPKTPRRRKLGPQRVSVTISIGAAWPNERTKTPNDVLKDADKALYRAKKQGRNRVST